MSNDTRILNTLQGKLDAQIKQGETSVNELFKMCEMENNSLHQLRLLGYKQTFAKLEQSKTELTRKHQVQLQVLFLMT